jgi:hypothetical protein
VPDGERHGQDRKAKSQRYTQEANTDYWKCCGQHGAAAASQDQPERAEELGEQPFRQWHVEPSFPN